MNISTGSAYKSRVNTWLFISILTGWHILCHASPPAPVAVIPVGWLGSTAFDNQSPPVPGGSVTFSPPVPGGESKGGQSDLPTQRSSGEPKALPPLRSSGEPKALPPLRSSEEPKALPPLRSSGGVRGGLAITTSAAGEVLILTAHPPALLYWDVSGAFGGEITLSDPSLKQPSDLATRSGLEYFVPDLFSKDIIRLDSRWQPLPPLKLRNPPAEFEPLSLCVAGDGTIFLLDRAGGDLWRVERDGNAVALGYIKKRGGFLDAPTRIRWDDDTGCLVALDGAWLRWFLPGGGSRRAVKHGVSEARGLAVRRGEAWVCGAGLACIDLQSGQMRLSIPSDTLAAWNALPTADMALPDDRSLILLPRKDSRPLRCVIQRNQLGTP